MQPPQNPYGQSPLPNPMGGGPSFQPAPAGVSSTTSLIVTGILGIVCCGFLAPYTWIKSNEAIKTLDAGYGNMADKSTYNITRIIGIIGTVLWILGVIGRVATLGQTLSHPTSSQSGTSVSAPSNP